MAGALKRPRALKYLGPLKPEALKQWVSWLE